MLKTENLYVLLLTLRLNCILGFYNLVLYVIGGGLFNLIIGSLNIGV